MACGHPWRKILRRMGRRSSHQPGRSADLFLPVPKGRGKVGAIYERVPADLHGQPRQWRSQRYGHGSFECALWTKEPNSARGDRQGKSRPWRRWDNRDPISPGSSGSAVGRWAKPGLRVRPHGAAREPCWSVRWIQWIGPHWRCLDFTESARMPRKIGRAHL